MVIDERHALRLRTHSPKSVILRAIGLHLVLDKLAAWWPAASTGRPGSSGRPRHRRCRAHSTALNRSIIGWMRSLFAVDVDSSTQRAGEPAAAERDVGLSSGSAASRPRIDGKRRPFSMPVKPAERDWRRHSSSDTSSREFAKVVVPPGDGRHAQLCFHACSDSNALLLADRRRGARAPRCTSGAVGALPARPRPSSASPGIQAKASVTMEITVVRSVVLAQSSACLEVGEALDIGAPAPPWIPHAWRSRPRRAPSPGSP